MLERCHVGTQPGRTHSENSVVAICVDCTSLGRRWIFNAETCQNQGKIYQDMGALSHLSQDTYCSCNTPGEMEFSSDALLLPQRELWQYLDI